MRRKSFIDILCSGIVVLHFFMDYHEGLQTFMDCLYRVAVVGAPAMLQECFRMARN